jgi:hypothetical protein
MTGRRARSLVREEMERRYYRLGQFLGGYLHEDRSFFYGTPEQAIDPAISEYPVHLRQQVRRELAELLAGTDDDCRLRTLLNDGLGVNLYFKKPREARAFAEEVEQKLLLSIRSHFELGRSRTE